MLARRRFVGITLLDSVVDLPILLAPAVAEPALFGGAVLCWARALGEFGATIMFAGQFLGRTQTMPLAIYAALESDTDAARGLSDMLLVISLCCCCYSSDSCAAQPTWLDRVAEISARA